MLFANEARKIAETSQTKKDEVGIIHDILDDIKKAAIDGIFFKMYHVKDISRPHLSTTEYIKLVEENNKYQYIVENKKKFKLLGYKTIHYDSCVSIEWVKKYD